MVVQVSRAPQAATQARALPPREAIERLAATLRAYGFERLYQGHADGMSVLSAAPGLTIWCFRGTFWWAAGGRLWAQRAPIRRPPR